MSLLQELRRQILVEQGGDKVELAKRIVDYIMLDSSVTPYELKKEFGLSTSLADYINRISGEYFGPGGKGQDKFVNRVAKELASKRWGSKMVEDTYGGMGGQLKKLGMRYGKVLSEVEIDEILKKMDAVKTDAMADEVLDFIAKKFGKKVELADDGESDLAWFIDFGGPGNGLGKPTILYNLVPGWGDFEIGMSVWDWMEKMEHEGWGPDERDYDI